jgi:ferric enterobactin receptor
MKTPLLSRLLISAGLLTASLLSTIPAARAQALAEVRGAVQGPDGAAIEYATVTLHRAADSVVVKTEFSDAKGTFQFERAAGGRYLVSAAQVGFERRWSAAFEVAGAAVSLPALELTTSAATQLQEVRVTGQKPLYERLADRTVVNVENSALAAGNTSLDVLRRAPGVSVDGSDNLALRGRQGLLVLIDGKRQPMTGTELADYLRALPAEQLSTIELITNPPAKYDAQGGAGIIAINLRKDQRLGTNGTANLSYGRGRFNRYTGGLTLTHRQKALTTNAAYTYSERTSLNQLTIHRDFYNLSGGGRELSSTTDQDNFLPNVQRSHSWRLGLDYNLTARTTLGAVVSGLDSRNEADGTNLTVLRDRQRGAVQTYNSTNYRAGHSPNAAANLNLRHAFADSLGKRELTVDLDYAGYRLDRRQLLQTFQVGEPTTSSSSDQQGRLAIQSAKLDYTQPLSKQLGLEMGLKASLVTADNDLRFYTDGQLNLGRSNRFRYDENINAGYLSLSYARPGLTLQAGLRGEQTNVLGRQDRELEYPDFTRHYFQLFPSASIKRTLSDKHELSLALSRRIDRPSYSQLNPFREIIDKTTFGSGNPSLLPQTSYNFDLTHTFRQQYSLTLSYNLISDPLIGVVQPETDSTVLSTTRNLRRQHYYSLTLTAPVEITKWWKTYTNVVGYYARFEGELAGTALNRSGLSVELSSNHSLVLGKSWGAEVNATYQSRQVYAFLTQRSTAEISVAVQKSFWSRRGTLKLNVSDLFYTLPVRATSRYDNYVEDFYQRRDSRAATLSFSYRFGNDKVAPTRRRQTGAEDEKRRAG